MLLCLSKTPGPKNGPFKPLGLIPPLQVCPLHQTHHYPLDVLSSSVLFLVVVGGWWLVDVD
jgi:hypothetical protein